LRSIKAAVYTRITADPTLMNLIDQRGPFPGRLPQDAPQSREIGAITYDGETLVVRGSKEDVTITLHIWTYTHDLAEIIAGHLDRLFRPDPGRQWFQLTVSDGQAFVRREFGVDVPDRRSELFHRVVRLRVRYGWAVVA
jgi:hypothetical protein